MINKKIQLFIINLTLLLLLPLATYSQGIDITPGGNITVAGAATLEISNGGFTNNGTYTKGTETFTLSGTTTLQSISGTALSDFFNLSITNTGGVCIAYNSKVTVSNTLTVNGPSSLTLNSTSNGTASLIHSTPGVTASVQRYIAAADWGAWNDGWHFLSSPVSNQSIVTEFVPSSTSTNEDFYKWDELSNMWINIKDGTGWRAGFESSFAVGRGYMVAYASEVTKHFTGSLNISDVAVSGLTISTGTNRSYHLLGNPFTSGLTWNTDWTKSNIGGVANIWNEAGRSYSPLSADGIIPAGNGFLVMVNTGTASLTIPAAKRVHSAQAWYKRSNDPVIQLFAHDLDNNSFQESQVRINPVATTGFDFEFDGYFLPGYAPSFYSVMEGENLMVNSLPEFNSETVIPFHFIKNKGTNFTIEVKGIETLGTSDIVFLKDKILGIDFNLSENNIYSFTSRADDAAERFELHMENYTGVIETQSTKDFNIYSTVGMINIQSLQQLGGKIIVSDMVGRTISTGHVEAGAITRIPVQGKSGVYLVSVVTSKGKINTKVIAR